MNHVTAWFLMIGFTVFQRQSLLLMVLKQTSSRPVGGVVTNTMHFHWRNPVVRGISPNHNCSRSGWRLMGVILEATDGLKSKVFTCCRWVFYLQSQFVCYEELHKECTLSHAEWERLKRIFAEFWTFVVIGICWHKCNTSKQRKLR